MDQGARERQMSKPELRKELLARRDAMPATVLKENAEAFTQALTRLP